MISAVIPKNEKARLAALEKYQILDSDPEPQFDEITELASQICETPIALVSLVDCNRQWFKSKLGLEASETGRDLAFCAHAIHSKNIFVVNDTLKDKRFVDNPLVTDEPKIRFYAGAPLVTPDNLALGTLCVIDRKPRELTESQLRALQILSHQVAQLLEHRLRLTESLNLTHELIAGREKITELMEQKKLFLASVNHEMRTPLNAIIGFSQRLIKKLKPEEAPAYVYEGLETIHRTSKHLATLVNQVLDLSKIDAGKMEIHRESFNPNQLIEDAVSITQTLANEYGVDLSYHGGSKLPKNVSGDAGKFSQVLLNIMSNAIRNTPEKKSVAVSAAIEESYFVIEVADEGVGISAENIERIFDEFEQIPNKLPNRSRGTGLGLTIVARLLALLKGEIQVQSKLGKGTVFTIRLPIQQSESTEQQ